MGHEEWDAKGFVPVRMKYDEKIGGTALRVQAGTALRVQAGTLGILPEATHASVQHPACSQGSLPVCSVPYSAAQVVA